MVPALHERRDARHELNAASFKGRPRGKLSRVASVRHEYVAARSVSFGSLARIRSIFGGEVVRVVEKIDDALPDSRIESVCADNNLDASGTPLLRWEIAAVFSRSAPIARPLGFVVAQFRAKVQSLIGQAEAGYTQRHVAYDLKRLRGKQLITKLGRSRRYEVSASSMRAVSALYVLLVARHLKAASRRQGKSGQLR